MKAHPHVWGRVFGECRDVQSISRSPVHAGERCWIVGVSASPDRERGLVEVAAAEAGDIDTEVAKTIPFDERVVFSGDDGVSDGGEMEGSPQ